MTSDAVWAKIRAEFEDGAGIVALAKAYAVPIKEIFERAKAEGWSKKSDQKALTVREPEPAAVEGEVVDEAGEAVDRQHRTISRTQRELYHERMVQYQAMLTNLARFDDQEALDQFVEQNDHKGLKDFLISALKAQQMANTMFEQLVRIGNAIIERERQTMKLDDPKLKDQQEDWGDLLEQVKAPPKARPLPENVVRFDRMMTAKGDS